MKAIATSARRRPFAWLHVPAAAGLALCVWIMALSSGWAQNQNPRSFWGAEPPWVGVPAKPKKGEKKPPTPSLQKPAPGAKMLVRADEVHYDYNNERVSAVGQIQIYYSGSTLEADKVVYDQKLKRMRAEGNVRLTEADGKVVHADALDLSDDYRDGFVDSLRLETPDKTRMAAARADRSSGRATVFQSGVYTACEACKEDPRKPPTWQVRAARFIHDHDEKMVYFEDARLEFFGFPVAYFPYLSAPDPTVKRKSGLLMPEASYSTKYGFAAGVPLYWAIAPDYDLTLTPMLTTRQGPLVEGEWRQRMINGSYSIRAAGIIQQDKDVFLRAGGPPTPGYRDFRGYVATSGQFDLSSKWVWGWNGAMFSDKTFLQDYSLTRKYFLKGEASPSLAPSDPFRRLDTEFTSQLYLAGRGDRSYFDARVLHFYGFSEFDSQKQLPIVHPVLDYAYTVGSPVLGGELAYKVNLTSLSREQADFDPIVVGVVCDPLTADPAIRSKCLLRGVPGTYTRASAVATWRRSLTDSFGQVFTPFASVRADAASVSVRNEPNVSSFIAPGEDNVMRAMPAVGIEYRYPLIAVHSWGTQTLEPIAQLIVRPSETAVGRLPNEDAQSLIFDDTNLFRVDKFSGWDRVEGGTRMNAGMQYTAQFTQAGAINALFGQSYQLFGKNSFASGGMSNTGVESGLETARSDYVARLAYNPNSTYSVISRFRFDEDNFAVRRFELEGKASFERWTLSLLYGNYDRQEELGFLTRREGILTTATAKLTQNWSVLGAFRYDISENHLDQYRIGLGYIDDCFAIAMNYITDYGISGNTKVDHKVFLQINLRTLGGTGFGN